MEAVGIGCIWFARRDDADEENDLGDFVPSAHVADIRRALESLDSVTNLKIEGNENRLTGVWGLDDDTEDQTFFPMFSSLVIQFDLLIPLRSHQKYVFAGRRADVETFHVRVVYEGSMPVAYVHYAVPGDENSIYGYSPATAVVVVRKFLEERLKDHPVVLFQMLGPSPCHVDVFVDSLTTGNSEAAKDLSVIGGGYRTLFFRVNATTSEKQLDYLISEHNDVLAAFYMIVRLRNHARALRETVTDGALDLLRPPERSSRWAAFQHWSGYRERLDTVFEALLHEKLNRVAQDRYEAGIHEDGQVDSSSLFYDFIEREISDPTQMPDEDIRELLVMLEERRRGYFQNASTLVSGVVGGLLGATLGAFLSFGLADHNASKPPNIISNAPVLGPRPATAINSAPIPPPASPAISPPPQTVLPQPPAAVAVPEKK
jgi:hypothetical protein